MINKYPLWKNLLILFILILGGIYAAPNFYPPDPAIQISHDSGVVEEPALRRATAVLDRAGIDYFGVLIEDGNGHIRLRDADEQGNARDLIDLELEDDYVVALDLAPNTPGWLTSMGAGPMSYGLDLSGGVHFLMEVNMEAAVNKQLNDSLATMRRLLREERLRYRPPLQVDARNRIRIAFTDSEVRSQANSLIREEFPTLTYDYEEEGGNFVLYLSMPEQAILELQDYALQQNLTTLRSRVDELGVKEPRVQPLGVNRIVVQLPGVQDPARAKELISAVATLEVRLAAEVDAAPGTTEEWEYEGQMREILREVVIGGSNITDARTTYDQNGFPQVQITVDASGAVRMNEATRVNVGRMMAILLIETKTRTLVETDAQGNIARDEFGNALTRSEPYEESRMISFARINNALGRQFVITGLQAQEANDLALLIRSGALAAPMHFLEERTVGPSLGQENIDRGLLSVEIGFGLVLIFMMIYFRFCGLAANIALAMNVVLLVAIMSIIGATLTLPGIAGIVLTIGMAVDANVLIFARIREELKNGLSVQKAINAGFERAFITILDANITTFLVAVILYSIGTGPVKGFAVTLSIGILTSMFTAIMGTRAIINWIYGGKNIKQLSIGIKVPESKAAGSRA